MTRALFSPFLWFRQMCFLILFVVKEKRLNYRSGRTHRLGIPPQDRTLTRLLWALQLAPRCHYHLSSHQGAA